MLKSNRVLWLLLAFCAACAGGQPPPPPTAAVAGTTGPSVLPTENAATTAPTLDFAPATAGPLTPSAAPPLAATATLTAPAGTITTANAVSLTQVAQIETGRLDEVAWSPDGALLAAAGAGGLTLYDTLTLSATAPITIGQWAASAAFSPDGVRLAVGTVGAIVQVWSVPRRELVSLLTGPGVRVEAVAYWPGGGVLASLGVDNRVHLWDVSAPDYVRALGAGLRPAYALAFSPSGDWLATNEGERVLLWHVPAALTSETPVARSLLAPAGRRGAVTAVAFSPAREQLAAANTRGTIELWAPDGTQPARTLAATSTPALALAFSPDGALLASAHQDMALRVWNAASGALLATVTGHADLVTSVAFSPDGTRLASSSWDGTVKLWGVPP